MLQSPHAYRPYRDRQRAEKARHALEDTAYEIAEDMAFTELISGVSGGGDAFHFEGAPGPDSFSRNKDQDGKLSLYSGREKSTK